MLSFHPFIRLFMLSYFVLFGLFAPAGAAAPKAFNSPGQLVFAGAHSDKREVILRVTPPQAGPYLVKITVNQRQALKKNITQAQQLNVPVPGLGVMRFKAFFYKPEAPQQPVHSSAELRVDARAWLQNYRLEGFQAQRISGPRISGLQLLPQPRSLTALPAHYQAVGGRYRLPAQLTLELGQKQKSYTLKPGRSMTVPTQQLPPGKQVLKLRVQSPWLKPQTWRMQVHNIGVKPPGPNFILVDKYNMSLALFRKNRLIKSFPIAIGTPKTPTPLGLFYLGHDEKMSDPDTDWGEWRLKIFRPRHYSSRKWGGYAIHGTNKPQSIGKEISLGCVRMFNKDIRWLTQRSFKGMPVLIVSRLSQAL